MKIPDSKPQFARIAAEASSRVLDSFAHPHPTSHHESRRQDKLFDVGQYAVAGPLFFGVAAVTSAVMLVGFVAITGIDRLRHH